jgi:hypothetical protein
MPGHDGAHDSGYCTWADAEALTREAADKVLRRSPAGAEYLDILQPLADEIEASLEQGSE